MQFAGRAGEDRQRPTSLTPSTGKVRQAPAEQVAGKVLLGDVHLSALPALAQLVQIGQNDLPQDRFDGEVGEQPVEHSLCSRFVHVVQGLREDTSRVSQATPSFDGLG